MKFGLTKRVSPNFIIYRHCVLQLCFLQKIGIKSFVF